jgi:hypothetical protein
MRYVMPLVAILLTACSQGSTDPDEAPGGSPSAAAVATGDACSLITSGEAESLLGGKVGEAQRNGGSAGYDQCQYIAEAEHVADFGTLTVQRLPVTLAAKKKALTDNGDTFEDVAGIGDGAVWVPGMSFLYVGHGGETLAASVAKNGIDMKAKSLELARAAVPRM